MRPNRKTSGQKASTKRKSSQKVSTQNTSTHKTSARKTSTYKASTYKASKRRQDYGQHFLNEKTVIQKIVQKCALFAKRHPTAGILEIGPGKGALTLEWISTSNFHDLKRTYVYEKDARIEAIWNEPPLSVQKTKIHWTQGDFLEREPHYLRQKSYSWVIFSNLPYSVGTPILESLIHEHAEKKIRIEALILMFQKEVAERITAPLPSREASGLSLFVQNRFLCESLVKVAPGCFNPPPQVWSEVLVLTPREKPLCQNFENTLEPIVQQAFQQRRKMLRSIFKQNFRIAQAIENLGIGEKRPEALAWNDWLKLENELTP